MNNSDLRNKFTALLSQLQGADLAWAAGYVQGRFEALGQSQHVIAQADIPQIEAKSLSLGLYYATETGNAKKVALAAEKLAKSKQIKTKALAFSKIKLADFKKQDAALFILSTHGEGEYPDSARGGVEILEALPDGALQELSYNVIGLGDRAYNIFCGAAVQLEDVLKSKGAQAFKETYLYDVDYEDHYAKDLEDILSALQPSQQQADISAPADIAPTSKIGSSRLHPAIGSVIESINLNDEGSDKETYHIEITYEDAVSYHPGDAVGIIIPSDDTGHTVPPRLYSIASSLKANEQQIHMTVALAKHANDDGSLGYGVCSHYLSQLSPGDEIKFYIHKNDSFRLPENSDTPVIMIGPGTGIAPFRAFLQEREATDAEGKNWLFFGDRTSHADFLYQAEWQDYVDSGLLTHIDLAFSRDDPDQKIYVQHKMAQKASELIRWLDDGAHIYVCGAKDPMAKDVEQTLLEIYSHEKHKTEDEAREWLEALEDGGRYAKDVY
ncbi:MAG: flavodoxin domain-containing protein [Pseudomonadota bacterium]